MYINWEAAMLEGVVSCNILDKVENIVGKGDAAYRHFCHLSIVFSKGFSVRVDKNGIVL